MTLGALLRNFYARSRSAIGRRETPVRRIVRSFLSECAVFWPKSAGPRSRIPRFKPYCIWVEPAASSEAIQGTVGRLRSLDCFVAALLAMTILSEGSTLGAISTQGPSGAGPRNWHSVAHKNLGLNAIHYDSRYFRRQEAFVLIFRLDRS